MGRYKKHLFLISILFLFLTVQNVHAALIVDTGEPGYYNGGYSLNSNNWLAGKFTLSQTYTITDMQIRIVPGDSGGILSYAIYNDGGSVPGSSMIRSSSTSIAQSYNPEWVSLSGLGGSLAAGTYWISLQPGPSSTLLAYLPDGAPNPLANYAFASYSGAWVNDNSLGFGLRVYGSAVPIPPSAWLLGTGLVGLVGLRRKFRK